MLTVSSPRAKQPQGAGVALLPHQLAMLSRCMEIEAANMRYGVMSDKPGAGKTYVLLAMIMQSRGRETNVVVVPQNIFTQWKNAIDTFCPMGVITYQSYITYAEVSQLYYKTSADAFQGIDLVLTTPLYFSVLNDAFLATKAQVGRVIVDEVDSVSSLFQHPVSCRMLWMVSASFDKATLTPCAMRMGINLASASQLTCRCEESFVDASFTLPDPVHKTIMCVSTYLDQILYGVLTQSEIEAANAHDFSRIGHSTISLVATNEKDALALLVKDLVATIDTCTVAIERYESAIREATQREVSTVWNYVDQVTGEKVEFTTSDKLHSGKAEAEEKLQNARKRYDIIMERLSTSKMCLICYDEFGERDDRVVTSCCQNTFCDGCITTWYAQKRSQKCPYCRSEAAADTHVRIEYNGCGPQEPAKIEAPPEEPEETPTGPKSKMDTIRDLLAPSGPLGPKVIIFSDYSKVFKSLSQVLDDMGITHVELDGGNMASIDAAIADYKSPTGARVLMSNSSFYGCGMNLENTTDIVFFHKPFTMRGMSLKEQVIGRAQRPGRTSALTVYNLLHQNETYPSPDGFYAI